MYEVDRVAEASQHRRTVAGTQGRPGVNGIGEVIMFGFVCKFNKS